MAIPIKSGDVLTYSAIILAFLAYQYPVKKEFDSILSLLKNLRDEIAEWVEGEYSEQGFHDKKSYLPIYQWKPVPSDATKELTKRMRGGIGGISLISDKLIKKISILHQKIEQYNEIVASENKILDSNPVDSMLIQKSLENKASDDKVSFEDFEREVSRLDPKLKGLANQIYSYRKYRHIVLISDSKNSDGLKTIYELIKTELSHQPMKPWLLRWSLSSIIISSLVMFVFIEVFFL